MPHWGSSSLCGKVSTGKNYSITTSFLFVSVYSYISTLSKSYGILGFSTNLQTCPPLPPILFAGVQTLFFCFCIQPQHSFSMPWIFVSSFKHCPNYFREGVRGGVSPILDCFFTPSLCVWNIAFFLSLLFLKGKTISFSSCTFCTWSCTVEI